MLGTKTALPPEQFRRSCCLAFVVAVLASTAWTPVAGASEFSAVIELSSLDGNSGFRLDGVHEEERSGYSVGAAGDVNGDGVDDLIIGAPRAGPHGDLSGSTYVVFGQAAGFPATFALSTLDGRNGFRLDGGEPFSRTGYSVAGAHDVNGDGFDDLIIGTRYATPTYVVFGKPSGFPAAINLSTLDGSNGFRLEGSGFSVAAAGDVNGDGLDDVIIGAHMPAHTSITQDRAM
jgi:hypothetical protein